jgi:hypothetical protein
MPPPSSMTNKPRPSEVYGLRFTGRVSHAKALRRHGIIRIQLQYCPGRLSLRSSLRTWYASGLI